VSADKKEYLFIAVQFAYLLYLVGIVGFVYFGKRNRTA